MSIDSYQFDRLSKFGTVSIGLLWQGVRHAALFCISVNHSQYACTQILIPSSNTGCGITCKGWCNSTLLVIEHCHQLQWLYETLPGSWNDTWLSLSLLVIPCKPLSPLSFHLLVYCMLVCYSIRHRRLLGSFSITAPASTVRNRFYWPIWFMPFQMTKVLNQSIE